MKNVNCNHGNAQPQCPPDWFSGAALYCYWLQGNQCKQQREALISIKNGSINGQNDFLIKELTVLPTNRAEAASLFFPPEVAAHVVKLACERPDDIGCSLSQWFCQDLASQLISEGIVTTISAETIRRILANHKLKPWRVHMWLSPKHPRDETFYTVIQEIIDVKTTVPSCQAVYSVTPIPFIISGWSADDILCNGLSCFNFSRSSKNGREE
jgi:hypothetical protein